jgi:hypothetical protein
MRVGSVAGRPPRTNLVVWGGIWDESRLICCGGEETAIVSRPSKTAVPPRRLKYGSVITPLPVSTAKAAATIFNITFFLKQMHALQQLGDAFNSNFTLSDKT